MPAALAGHGLTLTDRDGGRLQLPAAGLRLHGAVPTGLAATAAQDHPALRPWCRTGQRGLSR